MPTYQSKTWNDALFHYPTRYKIHHADTTVEQVTMENDFENSGDSPIQTGDVFDAATMNNLEQRVSDGFASCVDTLSGTSAPTSSQGKNGDTYYQFETTGNDTTIVGVFVKISGAWLEVATGSSLPQAEGGGF